MVRVRFAPSPTGIPHIGNTRTALFDYLLAKANKGVFILRIEDTDQKRIIKGAEEAILEILEWLGIKPDEKFKQSERLSIYKKHAEELIKKEVAYEKDGAVYMKVPTEKKFAWIDSVGNKNISFEGKDVEDFVILKSDGFPTYHLANVVDDYLMKITHVIRGEEWISSTPKHLLLYESFGWQPPIFVHLPVILGLDRSKLSKRHGAKSVLELREEGYLKEAILNFMALLGWNPGGDEEVMSLSEMVKLFKLEDINVSNPVFDIEKLKWMNGVYIRKLSTVELKSRLKTDVDDKFIELAKSRIKTLKEFNDLVEPLFEKHKIDGSITAELKDKLNELKTWDKDSIFRALKELMDKHKLKMSYFYKVFTGKEYGLPLPESLEVLGKEKTLEKLNV